MKAVIVHGGIKIGGLTRKSKWRTVVRKDPCAYCGRRMIPLSHKVDNASLSERYARRPTVDHIVPLFAGGPNEWTNLTGACSECNGRKGTMSLLSALLDRL